MSHDLYQKIYNTLCIKVKKSAFNLVGLYKPDIDTEDLIQIGLAAVFSKCGDLEKNFCENHNFFNEEEENWFWNCVIARAKFNMKSAIFKNRTENINFLKNKRHFSSLTCDDDFLDDSIVYFEDEELINWEKDNVEIKAFKLKNIIIKYIKSGQYSSSEVIKFVQSRFGISSRNMSELLSVLQNSMISNGFAKSSCSGRIILGDSKEKGL